MMRASGSFLRQAVLLAACGCFSMAFGQFGGRANEVVLYVVNTKGSPTPQIVPSTTANTVTGFVTLDPSTITHSHFVIAFQV
jgi:hypothetical protein